MAESLDFENFIVFIINYYGLIKKKELNLNMQKILYIIFCLLIPISGFCNSGVPLLMIELPAFIMLLIPIIIVEAFCIKKYLNLPIKLSLKLSSISNIKSTLIGIPITWACFLALEFFGFLMLSGVEIINNNFLSNNNFLQNKVFFVIVFSFMIAWLPPFNDNFYWMIPVATLIMLPFFYYTSVRIEYSSLRKEISANILDKFLLKVVYKANLFSYSILLLIQISWLIMSVYKKQLVWPFY